LVCAANDLITNCVHYRAETETAKMVQAGRVACIFTPFALSIATLVCLILVFLGGTSVHNNALGNLYFFKVSSDLATI
jgi:hypothetical protein